MRYVVFLLAAACALGGAPSASALAVYSYTGSFYDQIVDGSPPGTYTTSMRVTGSFTLAASLPANQPLTGIGGSVLAFSFDDGQVTLSEDDFIVFSLQVGTDALADIDEWHLLVSILLSGGTATTAEVEGIESDSLDGDRSEHFVLLAGSDTATANTPGTWQTTVVPEPSALTLLAAGLGTLSASRRSRRDRAR